MTNHPNRGRGVAKLMPLSIDIPRGPSGENKPLGYYVIAFSDGAQTHRYQSDGCSVCSMGPRRRGEGGVLGYPLPASTNERPAI